MTLRAAVTGEVATTVEDSAGDSHDVRVRLRPDQRPIREDCWRCACRRKDDANGDKLLVPLSRWRARFPRAAVDDPPQGPAARGASLAANAGRSLGECG